MDEPLIDFLFHYLIVLVRPDYTQLTGSWTNAPARALVVTTATVYHSAFGDDFVQR